MLDESDYISLNATNKAWYKRFVNDMLKFVPPCTGQGVLLCARRRIWSVQGNRITHCLTPLMASTASAYLLINFFPYTASTCEYPLSDKLIHGTCRNSRPKIFTHPRFDQQQARRSPFRFLTPYYFFDFWPVLLWLPTYGFQGQYPLSPSILSSVR